VIPIKLSLHNFMCYRDNVPPLSFNGIHTACISGDNGNGKSTLVDAITWALWGKTRAKSDDDLIHLGQTEMGVEFDFAIGGQPYRIIRKHARPKKYGGQGRTLLELQIASEDGFRTITGNTITQTQQAIIDILHMEYQTFVNSALLLQGRADAFTVKRPLERKQVLADILGLSFYDELAERAKNRGKEHEMVREQIRSQPGRLNLNPGWANSPILKSKQPSRSPGLRASGRKRGAWKIRNSNWSRWRNILPRQPGDRRRLPKVQCSQAAERRT